MAVEYSLNNYHSVADHADLTLPDGDWVWIAIVRPNVELYGQDILSTGEWGTSGTYNFYQFEDTFGFKYQTATEVQVTTVSAGNWALLVAQRSGGNLSLRSVPIGGSTVTNSGNVSISGSCNPSLPLMLGRRSDNGAAPFLGAISDAIFIPGSTISDADMLNIATGTAIDSFGWYSNAVFWAIPETSTNTDYIGSKTLTVNGTLSSAADPGDLVRFGAIEIDQVTESDTVFGFTALKSAAISQVTESDMAQSVSAVISADVGLVTEADAALSVFGRKLGSIGLAVESDQVQSVSPILSAAIGLTSETDESFQMSTGANVPITLAIETDLAQSVKPQQVLIGQVIETDQAQPFGHVIFQTIGQVSETDLAQILSAGTGVDIDIVTEADQAQSFAPVKPILLPIGLIAEIDQALTTASSSPLGIASEIDTALGMTLHEFVAVLPTNANANLYFIVDNRIGDAATLTATSTAAGFNVDNLQLDEKTKVWRSAGLSTQTITITWTDPENISAVGIAFSNLTRGTTVRSKLYANVADNSPIFDTSDESVNYSYGPPKGFSTIGLAAFSYGGGTYFSSLFETVQVKKMEILVDNPSNPDGYIEISKVVIGKAFTPTIGARYGAAVGHEDRTQSVRTDAGNLVTNRGTMNKILPFTLGILYPDDRRELVEMIRRNGLANPVFLSLYENAVNPEERQSHIIYGVIDELPSVSIQNFNIYNSTIQITEI